MQNWSEAAEMMKPTQIIKHYLSFSRGEQRGIIILVLIVLLINVFRIYIPNVRRLKPVDFSAFRIELERFQGQPSSQFTDPAKRSDSTESNKSCQNISFIIELNRADTLDLQRLRGIGPSFARRITGYRKRLGGFISTDQLMEVYGMDSARYLGIRKYLRVDASIIQPMNLNTISFKKLIAHPYMTYELAKEIALYRKRHKGIGNLEELNGLKNYDSVTFSRLRSYISVK